MPYFVPPERMSSALVADTAPGAFAMPLSSGPPMFVGIIEGKSDPQVIMLDGQFDAYPRSYGQPTRAAAVSDWRIEVDPRTAFDPAEERREPGDLLAAEDYIGITVLGDAPSRVDTAHLKGTAGRPPRLGFRSWRVVADVTPARQETLFERLGSKE